MSDDDIEIKEVYNFLSQPGFFLDSEETRGFKISLEILTYSTSPVEQLSLDLFFKRIHILVNGERPS